MSPQQAEQFAQNWIAAWNAHDLDQVLALYRDDFSMASPYIAAIAGEASGKLQGKPAVRAYWQAALERMPELHFELIDCLCGVNSLLPTPESLHPASRNKAFCWPASRVVAMATCP